jgi:hypothetical protein
MASLPIEITIQTPDPRAGIVAEGFIASQAVIDQRDDAMKRKIERLRSKHDDYLADIGHWQFLMRAYEGGPTYVTKDTLFKHHREHQDDYTDRLKRAHYQNYTQPLVDFVPEHIFKDPIDRQAADDIAAEFDSFKRNVDLGGTEMSAFWQMVAEDARLFGKVFVQIDKLQVPDGVDISQLSLQDSRDLGLGTPYFIRVLPMEVLDWQTDQFGNYTYIKRVEFTSDMVGEVERHLERYIEFKLDSITISVIDVTDPIRPKLISSSRRDNPWGFVPFIPVLNKRAKSNKDKGLSAVNDIAYQNRSVFNLTSLIDEFLYRQCFNILAMEKDTALPTREQVEGDIGTSNVLEVPRQANHFPAYVSPPVDPAKFIQEERAMTIAEMYRQAAQDVASELFARSNGSGDAAKQAFGRTVPTIARLADVLQNAEVKALTMWAKMQGKTWTGKVAYRDDYSITNLQDLLLQLATIFNTIKVLTPTFIREEWKRIIREFDGRITQEAKEAIYTEIDELSDDELVGYYRESTDMEATEGMPATANVMQGDMQKRLGTDRRISMATGNKAATKEAMPDANRRANTGTSAGRSS